MSSTDKKIRIAGIVKESIVDGEGLRYVIFTQGCNHNCLGCHNPETHDFNGGKEEDIQVIYDDITSNALIDGITLSGGDPLFQAKELLTLVKQLKKNTELNVWLYTGFIFDEFIAKVNNFKHDNRITDDMIKLLKVVDVVVDGPFINSKRTFESDFRGSSNQRLILSKESLKAKKIIEYRLE